MLAQALTGVIFRPKKCVGPLTLELEDDSAPSESAGRFPESPADDCSLPAGPFASGVSILAMICDREENLIKSRSLMSNGIRDGRLKKFASILGQVQENITVLRCSQSVTVSTTIACIKRSALLKSHQTQGPRIEHQ